MKITILTEGSEEIGFGHVMRCTSLYQSFEERGITPLFIVNGDKTLNDFLNDKNYELFNWLNERERLFNLLKDSDVIVIDSYLADYEIYEMISKLSNVPIYVDDNNRIQYPSGIVLNGSIFVEELNYPHKTDVDYLVGTRYIPLRKEFWSIPEKEINPNIETVMITFGGDDLMDVTPKILKILTENFPNVNKKVIIGNGFKNKEKIELLKDKKTELIYGPDADGMLSNMLEADIAISAGGQTIYELARVGVPTIGIAVVGNQINNVNYWSKVGFLESLTILNGEILSEDLINNLKGLEDNNIRKKMSDIGKSYVDGFGARRVAEESLKRVKIGGNK